MDNIKEILNNKTSGTKPPAYPWQDLALKIERELKVPTFKRNAVFKVCRDYPRSVIERCLADTKELCFSGDKWRYFFKALMANKPVDRTALNNDQLQTAPHKTKV